MRRTSIDDTVPTVAGGWGREGSGLPGLDGSTTATRGRGQSARVNPQSFSARVNPNGSNFLQASYATNTFFSLAEVS